MITLASGLSYVDLHFQGVPRIIATAVVHGPGGVALAISFWGSIKWAAPFSCTYTRSAGFSRTSVPVAPA